MLLNTFCRLPTINQHCPTPNHRLSTSICQLTSANYQLFPYLYPQTTTTALENYTLYEEKALLQRYTHELNAQEDRLQAARAEIDSLAARKAEGKAQLDKLGGVVDTAHGRVHSPGARIRAPRLHRQSHAGIARAERPIRSICPPSLRNRRRSARSRCRP